MFCGLNAEPPLFPNKENASCVIRSSLRMNFGKSNPSGRQFSCSLDWEHKRRYRDNEKENGIYHLLIGYTDYRDKISITEKSMETARDQIHNSADDSARSSGSISRNCALPLAPHVCRLDCVASQPTLNPKP